MVTSNFVLFLYDVYVSPLFDLTAMSSIADDNHIIRWNSDLMVLKEEMSARPKTITKCLQARLGP
jgi:hypothetical protein